MSSTFCNQAISQEALEPGAELQLNQALIDCNECLNRGEFAGALQSLDRALTLAPANPEILNHRGRLHLLLQDHDAARADFQAALQTDPDHVLANAGLARCFFDQVSYPEAEIHARRALIKDPGYQEAAEVLKAIEKISENKSSQARQGIQDYFAKAGEEFAGAEPPPLDDWHLKNSSLLPNRESILERMPQGGICAEIGTQAGDFARQILARLKPAKLHIFDIDFTPFDHSGFAAGIKDGTIELHQGDSSSRLATLPDRSFDFIYIDGDHAYEGVAKDLAMAARKIKENGWIVCNDYTVYSPVEQIQYGVYRAVNELCWREGFEILYLGLHYWSYHDVALRRMSPQAVISAGQPPALKESRRHGFRKLSFKSAANPATGLMRQQAPPGKSPGEANIIETIGSGDEMFTGDREHYFGVGKSALKGIETALSAIDLPSANIRRILDLPCGHGRVMRHLKAAFPQAQITACDLNRGAVDFCAQTFAAQPVYSSVNVNQIALPGSYDLIWSGSLLTHLRPGPCAEFVRLFNSLIAPGGLIVFTLHGRWVERSLATRRYTYGLKEPDVVSLLKEYCETGFGYADYPGVSGYGISVSSPAYVLAQLVSLPDLKLISYHEKGWDNHQDIVCLQKQSVSEPLG